MVHRPEIKRYVQFRQKEYRQRKNRKYEQQRKKVLHTERNNRITNKIGTKYWIRFFFHSLSFANVLIIIFLTSSFSYFLFNGLPRGPS